MITKQQPFEYTMPHTDNEKYRQNAIRKLKKSIKELNLTPQDLDLAA